VSKEGDVKAVNGVTFELYENETLRESAWATGSLLMEMQDPKRGQPKPVKKPAAKAPAEKPVAREAPPAAAKPAAKVDIDGVVFTLAVDDLDVGAALDLIAALTNVSIDTSNVSKDRLEQRISFNFDETSLADALQFICALKGFQYETTAEGVVIR